MKKLIYSAIFISAISFGITSCDKENDDDDDGGGPAPKTKTELLTQSSWKYDTASVDSDNNGTGDTPLPAGAIENCQRDNVMSFSANNTGSIDEGATKCNAANPQTRDFTWTFASNETVINTPTVLFANLSGDFKILTLSETQLIISKSVTIAPLPIPVTIVATFKH